jgi:hypothetical protein
MEPMISDHINQKITTAVITLSGVNCTVLIKHWEVLLNAAIVIIPLMAQSYPIKLHLLYLLLIV